MRLKVNDWYNIYGVTPEVLHKAVERFDTCDLSVDAIISAGLELDQLPKCFINGNFIPHLTQKDRGHWFSRRMQKCFFEYGLNDVIKGFIYDDDMFTIEQKAIASSLSDIDVPFDYINNCYIEQTDSEESFQVTYKNRSGDYNGKMGVGKFIKKIPSPLNLTDNQIEKLVNHLKTKYILNINIHEVAGEDIRKWYHYRQYADRQGSLSQSCMRHTSCQEYMDIYVENDVRMIVATNQEGNLMGRAIIWPRSVWNANYFDDMDAIVDRIYGKDMVIDMVKQYCYEKKYVHKTYQSYDSRLSWTHKMINGEMRTIERRCQMNVETAFDSYPYMDTFAIMDDDNLKNHGSGDSLTCTDGYTRHNHICENCESEDCNEDEMVYIENVGQCCDDCTRYVAGDDSHYLREDTEYIESTGEYAHQDDTIYDEWLTQTIHSDNAVRLYDDSFTHEDNVIYQDDVNVARNDIEGVTVTLTCDNETKMFTITKHMTTDNFDDILLHNDIERDVYDVEIVYKGVEHNTRLHLTLNEIITHIQNATEQVTR